MCERGLSALNLAPDSLHGGLSREWGGRAAAPSGLSVSSESSCSVLSKTPRVRYASRCGQSTADRQRQQWVVSGPRRRNSAHVQTVPAISAGGVVGRGHPRHRTGFRGPTYFSPTTTGRPLGRPSYAANSRAGAAYRKISGVVGPSGQRRHPQRDMGDLSSVLSPQSSVLSPQYTRYRARSSSHLTSSTRSLASRSSGPASGSSTQARRKVPPLRRSIASRSVSYS